MALLIDDLSAELPPLSPAVRPAAIRGVLRRSTTPATASVGRWGRTGSPASKGPGLDGVIAKSGELHYLEGQRVMTKAKHERTADCNDQLDVAVPEVLANVFSAAAAG